MCCHFFTPGKYFCINRGRQPHSDHSLLGNELLLVLHKGVLPGGERALMLAPQKGVPSLKGNELSCSLLKREFPPWRGTSPCARSSKGSSLPGGERALMLAPQKGVPSLEGSELLCSPLSREASSQELAGRLLLALGGAKSKHSWP